MLVVCLFVCFIVHNMNNNWNPVNRLVGLLAQSARLGLVLEYPAVQFIDLLNPLRITLLQDALVLDRRTPVERRFGGYLGPRRQGN